MKAKPSKAAPMKAPKGQPMKAPKAPGKGNFNRFPPGKKTGGNTPY